MSFVSPLLLLLLLQTASY